MERLESRGCFGGRQEVWSFESEALSGTTKVGVYLPPAAISGRPCPVAYWLSGLTCSEQNFITKAGAQKTASELGIILVAPDTSPRGDDVADDPSYDLGVGAGFYVNATQAPWSEHFRMYDFIVGELPSFIEANFPANSGRVILGHSMGGHGALMIALRNEGCYRSASAFSPIVAPSQVPWGQRAFASYLGDDRTAWNAYDTVELVRNGANPGLPLLIDQGLGDEFLDGQLQTHRLSEVIGSRPIDVRMQEGYDHSYYFIASFIDDHLRWHARHLGLVAA